MANNAEWYDIKYPQTARATPVGVADQGQPDHWVVERPDGELELLEPEEVAGLEFEEDYARDEATLPVRELFEANTNYSPDCWAGREEIPVTVVSDPLKMSVLRLEFPEGIFLEEMEEALGIDMGGE